MNVLQTIKEEANLLSKPFWLSLALLALLSAIFLTASKPLEPLGMDTGNRSTPASLVQPPCQSNKTQIDPQWPSPEDVVHLTFSGNWCDACVPKYASHQIIDHVIQVYSEANPSGESCILVITPWEIKVDVGPLPVGRYSVEFYISLMGLPPRLNSTQDLIVLPGAPEMRFLPLIVGSPTSTGTAP